MASAERLKCRVAVVTGGTKGIGQRIVRCFLKDGASVVNCSRSADSDDQNKLVIPAISGAADRARLMIAYKMYKDFYSAACAVVGHAIPARRMGDCELDIAGAVLGLVSVNGRFITGQNFCVDGGAWLVTPNRS